MQSDVAELAIQEFRKDWPVIAAYLEKLRDVAAGESGGGAAALRCLGGVHTPTSNTGVNDLGTVASLLPLTRSQS